MIYRSAIATLLITIAPIANYEVLSRNLLSASSLSKSLTSWNDQKLIAQTSIAQTSSDRDRNRGFELVILARKQLRQGNTQEALALFEQAIAIFQKLGDRYSEARTINLIGDVYVNLKKFEQAIANYQRALELISKIQSSDPKENTQIRTDEVAILQSLAFTFSKIKNQASQSLAVTTYEKALGIARSIKNVERETTILNNIGQIYVESNKFSQGIEKLQESLVIRQNSSDPELKKNLANLLLNIGFAYRRLGQSEKALDYYQQSLALAKKNKERRIETSALNNIAGIYRSQGKYPQAIEQYRASLALAQELALFSQEASTLNNIGAVYKELGQSANALKYFEEALQKGKNLNNRQFESVVLSNIGSIYDDQDKPQQALEYYQQALAIHQEINDIPAQGITLNNIGEAYRSLQQYEKALTNYQQALKIVRELGDRSAEASTLANMGLIYSATKRYPDSLTLNQQALAIHRQLGERRGESIDLSNLGYLFLDWNQPELAVLFFKQSVNVRESIRKDLRSLSLDDQKIYTGTVEKTYRDLANLLLQQNRLLEAQQVLDLLKVQELDDYLKNVRGNAETAKGIELLAPEQRFLTDYSAIQNRSIQAGKEVLDILKITPANRSPQQIQRLTELQAIQEQTSQQLSTYVQSPAVNNILKQISQSGNNPNNGNNSNSEATLRQFASLQQNLQKLSQKAAIFYPLVLEDRLELILVPPSGEPIRRTVNISQNTLNRMIVDFRAEVRDPNSLDIINSAQTLYSWLIQPIAKDLQQAGIQTIIYAPDGQLRYLPIAALHDGKQWLVESYAINTITAASLTNLSQRSASSQPRVLAGAFTSGRYVFNVNGQTFNFAGLPFAGKEVENLVSKLPNSTKFIDRDFSVNSTVAKFKQFNIIHLATHAAFVIGKPEDSFVMFGDGSRASLRDVSTWSLQNVDLVILSACETGLGGRLGNGTEIMGFGYQMEYAGAKAAIASLWQVSDGGTQALMEYFYGFLKNPQLTKAEVLARAQRSMIKLKENNQDFAHPYFWSPFIIIGNGL